MGTSEACGGPSSSPQAAPKGEGLPLSTTNHQAGLEANLLGDEGAAALAAALGGSKLRALRLEDNSVRDRSLTLLPPPYLATAP